MAEALALGGNPSSVHGPGRAARARLEAARAALAAAYGATPGGVIFTSGATEACDLALHGRTGPVLVAAVEHAAVLEAVPDALRIPVDRDGLVDSAALAALLAAHRPALVAVQAANNETGVCQDLPAIARMAHTAGARLFVDAAQAATRIPFTLGGSGADLAAVSAHKLGGPPGVGALLLAPGTNVAPRLAGGAQEGRRRAGTENLPGIAGFAAALTATTDWPAIARLRDGLEQALKHLSPATHVLGETAPRLPNTSCLATPGLAAELQLMSLDLSGVAVSSGAACSSGKVGVSHVLRAMGLDDAAAASAIRVSLGWDTQAADIDAFLDTFALLLGRHRGRRGGLGASVAPVLTAEPAACTLPRAG